MTIRFRCAKCGKVVLAEDSNAGQVWPCPNPRCDAKLRVPSFDDQSSGAAPGSPPAGAQPPNDSPNSPIAVLWYVRTPAGDTFGPVSKTELDTWANEGRLEPDHLIYYQGAEGWCPAPDFYPAMAANPHDAPPGPPAIQDSHHPSLPMPEGRLRPLGVIVIAFYAALRSFQYLVLLVYCVVAASFVAMSVGTLGGFLANRAEGTESVGGRFVMLLLLALFLAVQLAVFGLALLSAAASYGMFSMQPWAARLNGRLAIVDICFTASVTALFLILWVGIDGSAMQLAVILLHAISWCAPPLLIVKYVNQQRLQRVFNG